MLHKYRNFIRGVSVNNVGKIGVVLTTAVVISFIIFETAQTFGLIRNAYFGLITYLAFPVLFVIGLILIPIGWFKYKKQTGKSTRELLNQQFKPGEVKPGLLGSSVVRTIVVFTLLNVIILSVASLRMLHFMDSAHFCGTACHTVMNPEWVTYQQSPHARVPCVECHVGEGITNLIKSKLNGVRQMYLAAFDLYNTPIPTPVHQLRPARETCEHCHWPAKFFGQRLITRVFYEPDSSSTPRYTTLNVKIDAGTEGHEPGAHWHVNEHNKVTYTSVNDERRQMISVTKHFSDSTHVYHNKRLPASARHENERIMDCIDCHNRATHIYKDHEDAVNEQIYKGNISRSLPFIKREAMTAIRPMYNSDEEARQQIDVYLKNYYKRNFPDVLIQQSSAIDSAVAVLQDIYTTYIHPHMHIEWGTYPSHIGHKRNLGCFRCHTPDMVDDQGRAIQHDCTMCHSILAMDSETPLQYLWDTEEQTPERKMHDYLRQEFLRSNY